MEGLTLEAQEARRIYKMQYRIKNREKINEQQRAWRAKNPGKVREYQRRYWEKTVKTSEGVRMGEYTGKNPRFLSWNDYGIDKKRYEELQRIVKSGRYEEIVCSAAYRADEKIAEHILKSVRENKSYDKLEFDSKLGRICAGRSDFYSIRRLFFHYLDIALRDTQK